MALGQTLARFWTPHELVSPAALISSFPRACISPFHTPQSPRMAEPAWQETLRLRLVERNARESTYAPIIEQCTCMFVASAMPHTSFITIL